MYVVYTDASAMRPKDPDLRRAACDFWAGDSKSDSAAWSLPWPVQTVYRAGLFAILVAPEVFRGEVWRLFRTARGSWTRLGVSGLGAGSDGQPHLQARRPVGQVQRRTLR